MTKRKFIEESKKLEEDIDRSKDLMGCCHVYFLFGVFDFAEKKNVLYGESVNRIGFFIFEGWESFEILFSLWSKPEKLMIYSLKAFSVSPFLSFLLLLPTSSSHISLHPLFLANRLFLSGFLVTHKRNCLYLYIFFFISSVHFLFIFLLSSSFSCLYFVFRFSFSLSFFFYFIEYYIFLLFSYLTRFRAFERCWCALTAFFGIAFCVLAFAPLHLILCLQI